VAAVSVSGPVTRISPAQVPALAAAVVNAARAISAAMGFAQPDLETTEARSDEKAISSVN
jgi:hypothetical protein